MVLLSQPSVIPVAPSSTPVASQLYVWTAGGTLTHISIPAELLPSVPASRASQASQSSRSLQSSQASPSLQSSQASPSLQSSQASPSSHSLRASQASPSSHSLRASQASPSSRSLRASQSALEGFDTLRRETSSLNDYIEIPENNLVTTRRPRDMIPLFKFTLKPNQLYKLNVQIRARVDYKYAVPVLAKYYIETNMARSILNFEATYVSSLEIDNKEKTTNVLGRPLTMVVDTKLTLIKINATFQTANTLEAGNTDLRIHHGIQTDDPDATLYCLTGSFAMLSIVPKM